MNQPIPTLYNVTPIRDRITTALTLINMNQTKLIPLMYLADKELFLAMLLIYGAAFDEKYTTALQAIVPADEIKAALFAWGKLDYNSIDHIAGNASKCYFAMQDALAANRVDLFARAELTLKTIQKWTYMGDAEEQTPITLHHRSKQAQAAIDAYDAACGAGDSLPDFLADLIIWSKLNGHDFAADIAKAHSWVAADKSPVWGYVTEEQRNLLTEAILHHEDEPIDRRLLIDILQLNGMSIHDPLGYLVVRPTGMADINFAIAKWINDNFTVIDAMELAKELAEAAQNA